MKELRKKGVSHDDTYLDSDVGTVLRRPRRSEMTALPFSFQSLQINPETSN